MNGLPAAALGRVALLVTAALLLSSCDTASVPATRSIRPATQAATRATPRSGGSGAEVQDPGCPAATAALTIVPQFVPGGVIGRTNLATAYEMQGLYDQGLDGSGESVAIASWSPFAQADIDMFLAATGTPGGHLEIVKMPDGAPTILDEGSLETILDIETIRMIAPGAQVLDYQACGSQDFGNVMRKVADDGRASVASISYGQCETIVDALSAPDVPAANRGRTMAAMEVDIARAAAAGISIFVSSGDTGAFNCIRTAQRLEEKAPNIAHQLYFTIDASFPATSPSVTSVGGTYLSVNTDGSWLRETAWEDAFTQAGTGSGDSATFARPDWQVGLGDQTGTAAKRQTPDVAGPGDSDSGMGVVQARTCDLGEAPPCWSVDGVGGTSFAAPLWAGIALLAQQLATRNGLGRLGPLAPRLYRLANSPRYPELFHDVTKGGDLLRLAGDGWDYATGWGTPRVTPLVLALMDDLRVHPTVISGS